MCDEIIMKYCEGMKYVYAHEGTVCFNYDVMFSCVFKNRRLLGVDIWVEQDLRSHGSKALL